MFVLVVTRQAGTGELVRQNLGAEGWWVTAVADRETAVRSASDQAPELVIIDGEVDEAAELVRFFATRHGGPGALLLASRERAAALPAADADAVLPAEPDGQELAATAQRLLKQPPAAPEDGLPTPGQVLNAQDIFGDMLLEMETASDPPAPASSAAETAPDSQPETAVIAPERDPARVPDPVSAPAEATLRPVPVEAVAATAGGGELVPPVETRPMVIPEPTVDDDSIDVDLDFAFPDLAADGGAEAEEEAPAESEPETEPGSEPDAEPDAEPEAALASPALVDAPVGDDEREERESPTLGLEAVEGVEEEATEEPRIASADTDAGREEPREEPDGLLEPQPVLDEGTEKPVAVPAEAAPSVGERLAAMAQRVKTAAGGEVGLESREPGADPVPPAEDDASRPVESAPAPVPAWRRVRLPGGARFWLGVAAGLAVFLLASFLLDLFFSSDPVEEPAAVTVPAVDAVDLEEMVDQEMAKREAELRESLLEEERRLQQQLEELEAKDDG